MTASGSGWLQMISVGGVTISTYWEDPYACEPQDRPGFWNGAILGLSGDGPCCRIHQCFKLHENGLQIPDHAGWWFVNYDYQRFRWYCTDHLPAKYLRSVCGDHWTDEIEAREFLHAVFPRAALPLG